MNFVQKSIEKRCVEKLLKYIDSVKFAELQEEMTFSGDNILEAKWQDIHTDFSSLNFTFINIFYKKYVNFKYFYWFY